LYQKIRRTDSRVKVCSLTASEYFHEQVRKEEGFDGLNQESFLRKLIEINDLIHTENKLPICGWCFNVYCVEMRGIQAIE